MPYIAIDLDAKKASLTNGYNIETLNENTETTARWFRRNFATKNGATTQSESDIHFSMGHDDDSQAFPYAEVLLYPRCLKMDERVILSELHPTLPKKDTKRIISFSQLLKSDISP